VWLLVPLLVGLLPHADAAPIVLDRSSDQHALSCCMDALLDPGGQLTIDEVAARELRPLHELDLGIGRWPGQRQPILWLRFEIQVLMPSADEWYLLIGRPYNPGTLYIEEERGRYRAIPIRLDESGGSFRARLPDATGTHQVFLRIPGPIVYPSLLHVATTAGQDRLIQRLLTAQGVYLGLMLAMLLVNLLVGLLLRDRAQLWYVGFIAMSVAAFSLITGTASRFLFETVPAAGSYRLQHACLALIAFAGIQFSRLFLDTPRIAPRADRVMRGFLMLAAAVLVAVFVAPDELATKAAALVGVLVPLVALSAGISALRAGSRWARFYLVGWSLFSIGGFVYAVPMPLPLLDGLEWFQLSSALETVAFSAALADRLRILRGERAQAEHALARSEQRLQSIFDGTIEATWLLDGDARVLEVNDTAKRRWQITAERARGLELRMLPPWCESERASTLIATALENLRSTSVQGRFELAFGAAAACWFDVSVTAIDSGLTLVEARDITDLKQAELNAARAEKLAALGQLVAGVAHEVNNPNNFLTFNLPILQEYLDALRTHVEAAERERGEIRLFGLGVDEFFADATTLVGNMKHGAERIAGIVSQLKNYVRDSDQTQWADADVNQVVANAATLIRTQLRQWVKHFEQYLAEGLPRVRMNAGRIEQVVMNLLLNAGQAAGSVDGRVVVWTRREGDFVLIGVEDTGPGVPEAIRERIFEPFFTTKAGDQGTGMGLAISQRIVDDHGGTLELASGVAHKTRFIVRLPIAKAKP